MANLIITVISIALVAVAALMGAYYAGQAFMDGQAKAKANQILNDLKQVDAAIQIYNTQNNTILVGPHSSNQADLSVLVPNYIQALPKEYSEPSWGNVVMMFWSGGMQYDVLVAITDNINVCRQVEGLRTGTVPANPGSQWVGKFGCFDQSPYKYWVYYTLYGQP